MSKEVIRDLLNEGEVLGKVDGELASIDPGAPPPGSGDMEKADYDPNEDGVIAIPQGGTGATTAAGARTALELAALATKATVGTAEIDNDAVTYAKMQNVSATDKVLGRSTAGAGNTEEIPCTAAGRALLDDEDAAAQRGTLGLGTAAVANAVDFDAAGAADDAVADHEAAADPHTGYQKESEKGQASGYAGLDANSRVASSIIHVGATARVIGRKSGGAGASEECTLSEILDFIGSAAQGDILYRGAAGWARLAAGTSGHFLKTQGAAADPAWAAALAAPSWYGNIYGAFGNCDPAALLRDCITDGTVAATPTNISTSVARCAYFRPPANITVNKIRFFGVGNTTGIYRVAIYNADTLARVAIVNDFDTSAGAWGAAGSSLGVSLTAGQLYIIAVAVDSTGTTAGILCMSPTVADTTGRVQVLPKSFPGNLDIDSGFIDGAFAQFAVTSGALPDPAATIAVQAAWTGGLPAFWLDNSNA